MDDRLTEEFPVDWEDDDYVSRREFFRFLTVASGGLAVGSGIVAGWTILSRSKRAFEPMRIARIGDIAVGQSLAFAYPRAEDMCLLIHAAPGKFVAFSRRCTHLSCPVEYQPEQSRIYCPCHNGAFSLADGHVLQGPPPRPLPRIELDVRGDDIYAIGVLAGEA